MVIFAELLCLRDRKGGGRHCDSVVMFYSHTSMMNPYRTKYLFFFVDLASGKTGRLGGVFSMTCLKYVPGLGIV